VFSRGFWFGAKNNLGLLAGKKSDPAYLLILVLRGKYSKSFGGKKV